MTLPFDQASGAGKIPTEVLVGRRLKEIRTGRGLSMRALADRSGLNINTLSLIENGKTSPSVSTLEQLANALGVPLSTFFEQEILEKNVVYTPAPGVSLDPASESQMKNLAENLEGNSIQPFLVTLKPGMGSGDRQVVHTGFEFVYCLEGEVHYNIDGEEFDVQSGDSLVFEAHLPHRWENQGQQLTRFLMVFYPADNNEDAGSRHIALNHNSKEITMKIAVITEDGKTISQHFGRAPYYLVLTIEDGKVTDREMREKPSHSHFAHHAHGDEPEGKEHGIHDDAHKKHESMAEVISDCAAILCGGMGMGAYQSMRSLNIKPVVTDISDIDAAAQAYIDGKLIDHTELLH